MPHNQTYSCGIAPRDVPALWKRSRGLATAGIAMAKSSTKASAEQSRADAPARAHTRSPRQRPRTPQQLARQEEVFNCNVLESMTVRQLAAKFKISQDTVISDIRHEEQRRADELGARREREKARSVAVYQNVIKLAIEKGQRYDDVVRLMTGEIERDDEGDPVKAKGGGGRASVTDRTLDAIIAAQTRIDKIQGVDAPTKVDLGLQQLIDAINADAD